MNELKSLLVFKANNSRIDLEKLSQDGKININSFEINDTDENLKFNDAVLIEVDSNYDFKLVKKIVTYYKKFNIPILVMLQQDNFELLKVALSYEVDDCFIMPENIEVLIENINDAISQHALFNNYTQYKEEHKFEHKLKQPLAAMVGYLDLHKIELEKKGIEFNDKYLDKIYESIEKINDLISKK